MPSVTVFDSDSGEPMAITVSPTASSSESPNCSTVGLSTSTLITARSVLESRPTTCATARLPSVKTTVSFADVSCAAGATTWSLVST